MGRWAGNMGSKEFLEFSCRVTPGPHGNCSPCESSGRGPGREPVSTQTGKEAPQAISHSAVVLGGLRCVHWKYTIPANQTALQTSQQGGSLHGLQCPFVLIQGHWDVARPHHQVMSQSRELKWRWAVARSVGSGPSRGFKAFQPFCKT